MTDLPLAGRRILLTRPEGRAHTLVELLEARGAEVVSRSTIAFRPPADLERARTALANVREYRWIVFRSANGVRRFVSLAHDANVDLADLPGTIAAIGPATASALEASGLRPGLVAAESRSEGLAAAFPARELRRERVLVVRPETASPVLEESLRAAGAEVDSVPFYRTVAADAAAEVAEDLARSGFDAIVFTSPSSVRAILDAGAEPEALSRGLLAAKRIAIGAFTAACLTDTGFPADRVAEAPTDEAICASVLDALC